MTASSGSRYLSLGDNSLSSLPEGVFDGLSGVPAGSNDNRSALTHLDLNHNS